MALGVGGVGGIRRVKFSTDVNRNGGAGLEGPVAVLEARVWSGLGILERLTLGLGGFSISFFCFPTSCCVR